jgi:TBC1 domain family member 15
MAAGLSKAPASPTASFYDMSDEDEEEYNTISQPESRRGVKLLFSKSKVYVHPSPSAKDNIPGFIALVQQKSPPPTERPSSADSKKPNDSSNYLLAWVPESSLSGDDLNSYVKVDMKDNESPPKQTYLVPPLPLATFDSANVGPYTFSIPLSTVYSILVRPPSLGWWYGSIVINTRSGSSLPALFFHDSECESTILQKKKKARESFDPFGEHGDLFWGGDEVVRWLRRYVTVERSTAEPSVYLIDPSEEDKVGFGQGRKSFEAQESDRPGSSNKKKNQKNQGPGMDPLTKTLKETRWKILEQLSKVTTLTRRTAEDLANNKNIPPQVRRLIQNPEVQTIQDEFDSARVYLARWAMGIAEQSEKEKNQRIWTAQDILASAKEESSVGDFEILDRETAKMSIKDSKRKPVNIEEWKGFFDSEGRLQITKEEVMERVFHGGLDAEDGVRKEAWPFLLEVYDFNKTNAERQAEMNTKRDCYMQLKGRWWDRMIDGQATAEQEEWWKEQKVRIGKSFLVALFLPLTNR